ncbi:hypothetical protein HMPREF3226_02416 [Prevotella corporis]|uniref:Uncharacterized protein n=1 Tax=Prevotella corporis TaxID=28128 RepID=A0A133PVY4_9BACT|nr:hypothetical protein HMPREF3226_02416 [Prevotella corporis]
MKEGLIVGVGGYFVIGYLFHVVFVRGLFCDVCEGGMSVTSS